MASDSSHSFSSSSVMTLPGLVSDALCSWRSEYCSQTLTHINQHLLLISVVTGDPCSVQIKETRRSLKDSESGLEKMSIGHHIQDRGHVIERKENRKTGEKELNQDFQNMDE
ncbi:hypothetical protein M9458_029432, partial [Cirrhinus mrigala]